jgi:hypothetical protein
MNDAAPHPTLRPRGIGALLLTLLAGLFVALAGLAAVIVLPAILVLDIMGGDGGRHWPVYVWTPIVFLAAIYSVVAGLRAMDEPRLARVAILAGLALIAFFSFPPFWLSGS